MVENRVWEIRKHTDISKWFFYDTKSNPADILTPPKVHENFQNNLFWWKGATFLHEKVIVFKEFNLLDPYHQSVSTEIKSAVLFTKVHTTESNVESVTKIDRYNLLLKSFRITAMIFRFVKNLKNKVARQKLLPEPFIMVSLDIYNSCYNLTIIRIIAI